MHQDLEDAREEWKGRMYDEEGRPIRGSHTTKADEVVFETDARMRRRPRPVATDYDTGGDGPLGQLRTSTMDLNDFHTSGRDTMSTDLSAANDQWQKRMLQRKESFNAAYAALSSSPSSAGGAGSEP